MNPGKNDIFQMIVVLLAVSAMVVFALQQTQPPPALPASAPVSGFSAVRAFEHVRVIAKEPRLVGGKGFHTARDYVKGKLTALGLHPEVQKTRITIPDPLLLHLGWDIEPTQDVENILAKIEGSESQDAVLLVAHLDSIGGPGASDDGNGVAVLLETARALLAGPPLMNSVILLFTAPEETGLHGGVAFLLEHPWARDVKLVVNFDAGGSNGPSELTNTSPNYGWLIRELAKADPYVFGSTSSNGVSDSDFNTFKYYGFSGFAFDYSRERRRHSPMDTLENVSLASMQHQGYHALNIARHFGNLVPLQDLKEPSPIYFNLLRLGMIHYPTAWVIPITLIVTAVFIALVMIGFQKKFLTSIGLGLGVLVFVISLIIAPLFARLLWAVMADTVPKYQVTYYEQAVNLPLLLVIFSSATLAILAAWYVLLEKVRPVRPADLTIGALTILTVANAVETITSPEDSFWLTWPLFFNLIAVAYWFLSSKEPQSAFTGIQVVVFLGAAAITIAFFIPSIYMDFTGSATDDLFNPMLSLVVMIGLLIPIGFILTKPYPGWIPVAALLIAAVVLGFAILA